MGLKQEIMRAKDEAEIAALQEKAQTYKEASPKTRRQWQRKDHKRRDDLAYARTKEAEQKKTVTKKPKQAAG